MIISCGDGYELNSGSMIIKTIILWSIKKELENKVGTYYKSSQKPSKVRRAACAQ